VIVFVLATALGLISLTVMSVSGGIGSAMESTAAYGLSWHNLRALELYLMTASLGIIVAIMTSSRNVFVVSTGLLLIGALIVPSRDMVRFALLFTESAQKIEDLFPERDVGTQLLGRDTDLANNIISALQLATPDQPPLIDPSLSAKDRDRGTTLIVSEIREERAKTLAERVTQEGGQGALFALGRGTNDFKEYAYQQGRESDFLPLLAYLRSQSLVDFDFSNAANARITCLGYDVAQLLSEGSSTINMGLDPCGRGIDPLAIAAATAEETADADIEGTKLSDALREFQQSFGAGRPLSELIDDILTECADYANGEPGIGALPALQVPGEITYEISRTPVIKYLSSGDGVQSRTVIDVSNPSSFSDSFVVVVKVAEGECTLVDYNDDHPNAPALDARLSLEPFPANNIFGIAVGDYVGRPGSLVAKLTVED
jgi:hypothetical protein